MDYTSPEASGPLITVVETPEFIARATALLTSDERDALVAHLAANPTSGVMVVGAGGIRKLRWALQGRGRRGGARVIYFFHSVDLPLFALTIFAKNERVDLSQSERNEFRRLTKMLVRTYRKGRQ